jgi:FlaA1/EpsC-like NDP-sugar epimerase
MDRHKIERWTRNGIAALHDAIMSGACFLGALYIRLGDDQMAQVEPYLVRGTGLFVAVCMTVFLSMRLYRGIWRYASMRDMVNLAKAVSLAILIFASLMFLLNRLEGLPRSVLFILWLLMLVTLGGARFAYRALKDRTVVWAWTMDEVYKLPVLLVGAGDAAEQFIRDSRRDGTAPYEVVGLTDENLSSRGRTIHGIPIYGNHEVIPTIIRKLERKGKRPVKLIVSDEQVSGTYMRELLDMADGMGIPLARLPRLSEFKTGTAAKNELRAIAVEDLLGRAQNTLDRDSMKRMIAGKRVLVTGAGGTIGGELARQIASYEPHQLVIVELSEFHMYKIERELRETYPLLKLTCILCDVRDAQHIDRVFAVHQPELVFHAAAIKHVPIAEENIEETVLTNVFGSRNVANACLTHHTDVMVMISTDKAVNPTNVMGASKRLAESFCQALGQQQYGAHITRFVTVRFGNVLGSTGSVVPLFTEQLAKGGPLTVTHPDMTRYFMTVREAVELVLQASVLGNEHTDKNEFIFVLDMGQPVRILDLAVQMIRLAGLRPNEDIKISFTGLRPGEKLYEELFHFSENAAKTSHASIFLASPRFTDMQKLAPALESLVAACKARHAEKALGLLKELVPEFSHAPNKPNA